MGERQSRKKGEITLNAIKIIREIGEGRIGKIGENKRNIVI